MSLSLSQSSSSSCSSSSSLPSSSANTIRIAGKSILKKRAAPQTSLFSRFSRFLPASQPTAVSSSNGGQSLNGGPVSLSITSSSSTSAHNGPGTGNPNDTAGTGEDSNNIADRTLRRAHFILPHIATVYPISSQNPPSTPTLKDEKKAIEERERERRRRVVRGNSVLGMGGGGTGRSTPALSVKDGVEKQVEGEGGEEEEEELWNADKVESFYRECCDGCSEPPDPLLSKALKACAPPTGTGRTLDLSGVQMTAGSAGLVGDVLVVEWGLRTLVCKECDLDEQTLKPILHALLIPNSLAFLSLASNRRLRTPAFRLIGAYVSKSASLTFLDLSQNTLDKKSVEHIVAALSPASSEDHKSKPHSSTPYMYGLTPPCGPSRSGALVSLRLDDCNLRGAPLEVLARAVRTSSLRHISLRHNRIPAGAGVALALMIRDYPDIVSGGVGLVSGSAAGASPVTSPPGTPTMSAPPSLPNAAGPLPPPPKHPAHPTQTQTTYTPYIPRSKRAPAAGGTIIASSVQGGITARLPAPPPPPGGGGPSAALLDKVRALSLLPRIGSLRTLDLQSNDLRTPGITYLAQILKRNRTLKVLNLADNKLDVGGLCVLAEALKYNACLETLDLGRNPCCGPGGEGVRELRTAFTLNTSLKRLFLPSTGLTSLGAIALAEFLPESTSLLHLDLTQNKALDLAGVMALNEGLKRNTVMRCLDLDVPPGDEGYARMCREILGSCVRNTEDAERDKDDNRERERKGVWTMLEESELARVMKRVDEDEDVCARARVCLREMQEALESSAVSREVKERARKVREELGRRVERESGEDGDAGRMEVLLGLNEEMGVLVATMDEREREHETAKTARGKPALTLSGLGIRMNGAASATGIALAPDDDDEMQEVTPRQDKGKEKAIERIEMEKVLSPTRVLLEQELGLGLSSSPTSSSSSSDEGGEGRPLFTDALESQSLSPLPSSSSPHSFPSDTSTPTPEIPTRSKIWVEEEGEVFRKGNVLLGPEEMEGEYAGEELRKELLDAMVERPMRGGARAPGGGGGGQGQDDFGLGFGGGGGGGGMGMEYREDGIELEHPLSPTTTTTTTSPTQQTQMQMNSRDKPPPRPYVSRSRSSSSLMTLVSSSTTPASPTVSTMGSRTG